MLKKRNLSELAYEELVNWIIRGSFKAGETLQEEKLSEKFGWRRYITQLGCFFLIWTD